MSFYLKQLAVNSMFWALQRPSYSNSLLTVTVTVTVSTSDFLPVFSIRVFRLKPGSIKLHAQLLHPFSPLETSALSSHISV